jgi:hypothetical protein
MTKTPPSLRFHPEILRKHGKNQFVILAWEDFQKIQEELEDLADLRALDKARAKEGKLPGISSEEIGRRLDMKFGSKRPAARRNGR